MQNFKEKREWRMGLGEESSVDQLAAQFLQPRDHAALSPEEKTISRMQKFLGVQERKAQGGYLPALHPSEAEGTYTLVLDMDETLVHFDQDKPLVNGQILGSVARRPYLEKFLETVAGLYEVVVFTSALQEYADVILDDLDPHRRLFSHRLYRQHCVQRGQQYLKDLTRLGRSLHRVIIVDNLKENFSLQPENGIFVDTWTNDTEEHQLNDLLPLLVSIPKR